MTQTQQMDADVAGIETVDSDFAVSFTFQGRPFIGQRTPIMDKLAMVDAGYELSFDFGMEVRLSQFTAQLRAPANMDIITIADVEYCIVATSPDQLGIVNHYAVKQRS